MDYRWRGINRRGAGGAGGFVATPAEMAAIVGDRFKIGWRSLTVESAGRAVAQIKRDDDGKRIWWVRNGQ